MKNVLIAVAAVGIISCGDRKVGGPTWGEVAPVVFENCSPCHRPGGSGGFSLLSFEDVKRKGNLIRFVTRTRYMPPWPADPAYRHFAGERVLSEDQIGLIGRWVESGMPKGTDLPDAPVFTQGSALGKPDLVIYPQHAFEIPGTGTDQFFIAKYPYAIARDTIAELAEFVPDKQNLVHHVNGHLLSYDASRSFDYFGGTSIGSDARADIMTTYEQMHIPYTDGLEPRFPTLTPNTVYYLPGFVPPRYPASIGGFRLKKNGVFLLNNIHFGPSNVRTRDSSHINVFYRRLPIDRPLKESQLGTFGISPVEPELLIPADSVKTFYTHTAITRRISMLAVNPHMHLLGKSFLAFALTSSGDTVPIIRIPKWDFRWQYYYSFLHPVVLEPGWTLHAYATFDNTRKNPNNPFHPPRDVGQGGGVESMRTTEEMFQLIFSYVPYRDGDEKLDLGK